VLFAGQHEFQQVFLDGMEAAPQDASALDTVAFALQAASAFFPDERRPYARLRQTIIVATPGLHERELLKMAWLSEAIAGGLRGRGIAEPHATLAAETGVTVFGVAFRQWIAENEERSLAEIEVDIMGDLRALSLAVH